ncbi:MAG TPA: carbohydrate binding domain-containing protein [Polyangia bacterium]
MSFACVATALGALAAASAGCDSTAVSGAGGAPVPGTGGGGKGGASGAGAVGCTDPEPGVLDLVDDMEDGDALLLYRGGRSSVWYTYHDKTTGSLTPDEGTTVTMEPIPGGRCGISNKAIRVTGSGWTDWGAGFGFDFHYDLGVSKEVAYDVSAYKGMTFWARIGEMSVNTVRFGIGDQWSRPDGGHCDLTLTSGATACYDTFGSSVTLTTSWQRFVLPFDHLQQRGFGWPEPNGLETTTAMNVEFAIPPSSPVFDIWIDDIALYK